MNRVDTIRLALPSKGHLSQGSLELLQAAGYRVRRASERHYEASITGHPRFHVVFMRPGDIVVQVQEGRCQLGMTGLDVYAEHDDGAGRTVVVAPDLGYGGCRLVVAVPESWVDIDHLLDLVDLTAEFKAAGRTLRVSTKYPNLVRSHFRRWGIYYYEIVASDGALELHPSLGIADLIVDLTSSGTTLKEHRLREIEAGTVLESAACLVGHRASLDALVREGEANPLARLLDALDGVRSAEGWSHLEVVGHLRDPGRSAAEVAECVRRGGGQHVCHGEVWGEGGRPGWRVTALVPAQEVAALRRPLLALGATRIVALPPQSLFDTDEPSTYDRLKETLAGS
ncbi:MAG: ATP phosphoribosyltransferase [Isosphaeraceae bacterium]|jgi:ATP phosphoribosyltransferase|nr:MAG: ATP phosphoribosyltransferase [Isosphaeraceae bacterium]